MHRRLLPPLALFLCTTSLLAQRRVWVVDRSAGPGAQFLDIQSAIQAASPGDRIEVRYANSFVQTYAGFVLTRGIEIVGVPGAFIGPSTIQNVPAGERARLLSLQFLDQSLFGGRILTVTQCAEPVLLSSVAGSSVVYGGMWIERSNVLLLDGMVQAGLGANAVTAINSLVTLQRCTLFGGNGEYGGPMSGGHGHGGGIGLSLLGSSVFAAQCRFAGGNGGDGDPRSNGNGGNGGSGVSALNSQVLLTSGYRCSGGTPGNGLSRGQPGYSVSASGTAARVASDVVLAGPTANTQILSPLPWVQSPSVAPRGANSKLIFAGPPGTLVMLYMDRRHDHVALPGIDGPLLVTANAIALPLLAIGQSGTTPLPLAVPTDPGLAGQFVFFQGVAFQPGPALPSLTNLGDLRIQ